MTDSFLLLDPSLLQGLSPEERDEALAAAAAAQRAEERAEQRALERAMARKEAERKAQAQAAAATAVTAAAVPPTSIPTTATTTTTTTTTTTVNPQIKFVSKRQRLNPPVENHADKDSTTVMTTSHAPAPATTTTTTRTTTNVDPSVVSHTSSSKYLSDKERQWIQQKYLGKNATSLDTTKDGPVQPPSSSSQRNKKGTASKGNTGMGKKSMFRFQWDDTDDTLDQTDPLYSATGPATTTTTSTTNGGPRGASHRPLLAQNRRRDPLEQPPPSTNNNISSNKRHYNGTTLSVHTKPLDQMTTRDWRIYRENYEIVVKGGRAPPPLRNFKEAHLHPALLQSIETVLKYTEPMPIQRQAIPIGLQRRDLIGIAETGSGKTAAFGVPLLQYIFLLSPDITGRVADDGPLALVLAPTRELALQIHGEFQKLLSRQSNIKAAVVVGGQSIQHQAQELRQGVHVVVGTPGRINDCIEMAYMVLNQCCYIVLDEADRMIDMGFKPQMESILDSMGGLLKSSDEHEAYQQEEADRLAQTAQGALPRHRVTAMFSATMPLEVETMAKRYLRHPAVISIGDQDSSKNARIQQKILFLASPSHKEKALRELILNPRYLREKVIVFVNEKKHADGVSRMVERTGRQCVVLHGGKSQEQREEALAMFRNGGVVLVATDVAGRGLDIPNVAHVINYDLPTRSIDSYNHRIGRTGRAGREGLATSLLTDEDVGIMAPLKQYLQSTGQPVPEKLARHPAATASGVHGHLIH